MAMRPIFVPEKSGALLVSEVPIEFKWHPGMAPVQKKKNVAALHEAAKFRGLNSLLEISSKSEEEVGRRLSAFNLKLDINGHKTYLECAYQGSKVFRDGGPFTDLFFVSPREAKKDSRLQNSGPLVGFELMGKTFPLSPKNAFYDWLYIKALLPHRSWICKNVSYDGYSDIEFNPGRSINCQARAFAEMIALAERGQLEEVADDFEHFANLLPPA
jgi:hypothetical protein